MQTETLTAKTVENWIEYSKNRTLVAGYGSLMSGNSRRRFNAIDCCSIGANVHNWARRWITRSHDEKQTYVGAIPTSHYHPKNQSATFNVQIVPVVLDTALIKREQDYKFTPLNSTDLTLTEKYDDDTGEMLSRFLRNTPVLICETLAIANSDEEYPVNLSYIATCLKGCYDYEGLAGMQTFMQQTIGWDSVYVRVDTHNPYYPRAAQVTPEFLASCMSLIVQYVPEERLLRE